MTDYHELRARLFFLAGFPIGFQQNFQISKTSFDIPANRTFLQIIFLGNLLIRIAVDEVQADECLL